MKDKRFPVSGSCKHLSGKASLVQATGEFRCPRKGEWFLSGAIVQGYHAGNDIPSPYYIAKLVRQEPDLRDTLAGIMESGVRDLPAEADLRRMLAEAGWRVERDSDLRLRRSYHQPVLNEERVRGAAWVQPLPRDEEGAFHFDLLPGHELRIGKAGDGYIVASLDAGGVVSTFEEKRGTTTITVRL